MNSIVDKLIGELAGETVGLSSAHCERLAIFPVPFENSPSLIDIIVRIRIWAHCCCRYGDVSVDWMMQMHIVGHGALLAAQRWALNGRPVPQAVCVTNLAMFVTVECDAAAMSVSQTQICDDDIRHGRCSCCAAGWACREPLQIGSNVRETVFMRG